MAKFDYLAALQKVKAKPAPAPAPIKSEKAVEKPTKTKRARAKPTRNRPGRPADASPESEGVCSKRFLINLTPAMHDQLQETAQREMRSMSGVIRVALQQYIDALL